MFEITAEGIRIIGTSLWLDANKKVPLSFISHAHADHIKRHHKIIATPETISFFQHRLKKVSSIPLTYKTPYQIDDVTIELFPSGHILGAAQILVIKDNVRLVYTGDLNTRESLTAQSVEIREADILIMESTFGLPQYQFPQRWKIIERLVRYIDGCFSRGQIPVIMSYSLGKSQEVIKMLGDLDYQISVHPSIYKVTKIYEAHGITFKNWKLYDRENIHNSVMIIPPYLKTWMAQEYKGSIRKLVVTGWAVDENVKYRYGADEAIPFSNHADFNDLLNYVKQVSPKKVYITHGFDDFVYYLRREGFDAQLLKPTTQISLF